jgi:hypothetical protein
MTKLAVGFAEAEKMTDISQWTWRRLVSRGTVKAARCGDRIVIPISELKKIVKAGATHETGEKGKTVRRAVADRNKELGAEKTEKGTTGRSK